MKFNNLFVVDDDKVHHFIIKKLLEKNSIQVNPSFFENGFDALCALNERLNTEENLPDLILLDINMPVLDGWQFMEELKDLPNEILDRITLYIVSSSEDYFNTDKLEQFKCLIEGYIVKPMTSETILNIFQQKKATL
ncbi:response regulator [Flavobacterium sp.]|uniref:response regulator n=1 Tax=Flavobacterium sp. TaxID=239 RepID=UPI00391AE8AE